LKTIFPKVDQEGAIANACYRDLRKLGAEFGCAFTAVHHPRKPSNKPEDRPADLEEATNLREWFYQSRGSQELINGCDVRIGVGKASTTGAAIVVRGFGRVEGEFSPILLARDSDAEGRPVGYRALEGLDQLNADQLTAFRRLPPTFKFKDAEKIYGRQASGTNRFLKKLIQIGLVKHDKPRELYLKLFDSGVEDSPSIETSEPEVIRPRSPSLGTFKAA
jgi:hypothetical protein